MFTLDQIQRAHAKVKSGVDFPAYIQELKELGVKHYETFVPDGHTDYSGAYTPVVSPAKYEALSVADVPDADGFLSILKKHQQGGSDYPTFIRECAQNGVFKWKVDLAEMTCTYYDATGQELLTENIPQ